MRFFEKLVVAYFFGPPCILCNQYIAYNLSMKLLISGLEIFPKKIAWNVYKTFQLNFLVSTSSHSIMWYATGLNQRAGSWRRKLTLWIWPVLVTRLRRLIGRRWSAVPTVWWILLSSLFWAWWTLASPLLELPEINKMHTQGRPTLAGTGQLWTERFSEPHAAALNEVRKIVP